MPLSDGRIASLYQYCLFALPVLLCLSLQQATAQEHRVSWEDLAEHVADHLLPLEELSVTECPASLDYEQAPSRSVRQWIENTFYSWTEYQLTPGAEGLFCIVMEEPHSGALSQREAGVLVSASRLWTEAVPEPDDMEILDPDDPRLNLPVLEFFVQEEAEAEDPPYLEDEQDYLEDEQDDTPDEGIGPEDVLEPWDEGVSSLPHPAEASVGDLEKRVSPIVFAPDRRTRGSEHKHLSLEHDCVCVRGFSASGEKRQKHESDCLPRVTPCRFDQRTRSVPRQVSRFRPVSARTAARP